MSRLRSSRGSSRTATPRPAAPRRPGILVQTPKSDIFVVMLGVAFAALLISCILMLLIWWRYDFKINAKLADNRQAPSQVAILRSADGLPSTPLLTS